MDKITLEKTHALLEKLAEHVMNNIPTKQEMNARFERVDTRFDRVELDLKETKTDVKTIIEGMDTQAKELEIVRHERIAISHTLDRHEQRITKLEQNHTGYRINDKED